MQSGTSSSALINRHFSQLGVPIVRDRSICDLPASGISVSQRLTQRKRRTSTGPETAECLVCQDRAMGCDYGAAACDSCQSFFERTVRLRQIHDCHFKHGCDLRLMRRNHCLGCRWDKCLEVGMSPSAVKKRCTVDHLAAVAWDSGHKPHQVPWSPQATTPQPSLPSLTDTEDSSQDSSCCCGGIGGRDSADGERVGRHLIDDSSPPNLPISASLVRAALNLPTSPPDSANATNAASITEDLRARLASLERACLVELFRWNKRRLVGYSERGFGAAAANWMPILVATAVRHHLTRLPPAAAAAGATGVARNLKGRLEQLVRGFDSEITSQIESLAAGVGDLCGRLLWDGNSCGSPSCPKADSLAAVILMMGDLGEDELLASLQSTNAYSASSSMLLSDVTRSLLAVTELVRSTKPELRALLLTALVSDVETAAKSVAMGYSSGLVSPDNSGSLSTGDEGANQVPGLIGL